MRLATSSSIYCVLALTSACGDQHDGSSSTATDSLATSDDASAQGGEFSDDIGEPPAVPPTEIVCERGGAVSAARVVFRCTEITVQTCKDLSNVVIEYDDGERQRFEGLKGHENDFAGAGLHDGAPILRVWVKAGSNASGEGPGYGERFDAPPASCERDDVEPPAPADASAPSAQ